MVRILLSCLLCVVWVRWGHAQSFSVSETAPVESGAAGTVLKANVTITNTSSAPITLRLTQNTPSLLSGHSLIICWGDFCTPDQPANEPLVLQPNVPYTGMIIELKTLPTAQEGTSTVSYVLQNATDLRDRVTLNYTFNVTRTTNQLSPATRNQPTLLPPTPNPATDVVSLGYSVPGGLVQRAALRVHDLMGREVYREAVAGAENPVQVSVKHLKAGVYFCSLEIDGKAVATRRLVVAH
jgi:hypothetical protein